MLIYARLEEALLPPPRLGTMCHSTLLPVGAKVKRLTVPILLNLRRSFPWFLGPWMPLFFTMPDEK
jgi:hypothetical protein